MKIKLGSQTYGATRQSSSPLQDLCFQKPDSGYHLDGKHNIPYSIIWTHQHKAKIIDFILWFARMWFHVKYVLLMVCYWDDNK